MATIRDASAIASAPERALVGLVAVMLANEQDPTPLAGPDVVDWFAPAVTWFNHDDETTWKELETAVERYLFSDQLKTHRPQALIVPPLTGRTRGQRAAALEECEDLASMARERGLEVEQTHIHEHLGMSPREICAGTTASCGLPIWSCSSSTVPPPALG